MYLIYTKWLPRPICPCLDWGSNLPDFIGPAPYSIPLTSSILAFTARHLPLACLFDAWSKPSYLLTSPPLPLQPLSLPFGTTVLTDSSEINHHQPFFPEEGMHCERHLGRERGSIKLRPGLFLWLLDTFCWEEVNVNIHHLMEAYSSDCDQLDKG